MNIKRWLLIFVLAIAGAAVDVWTKDIAFERLGVPEFTTISEFEARRGLMEQAVVEKERRRIRRVEHRAIAKDEAIETARSVFREVLVDGWFDLKASLNPGAFSGLLGERPVLLVIMNGLCLALLMVYLLFWTTPTNLSCAGVGIVAAGALGNLWDRFAVDGVRDFLHLHYHYEWNWNIFNIADVWIVIGVGMVILHEFLRPNPAAKSATRTTAANTPASAPPGETSRRPETGPDHASRIDAPENNREDNTGDNTGDNARDNARDNAGGGRAAAEDDQQAVSIAQPAPVEEKRETRGDAPESEPETADEPDTSADTDSDTD